ncbi:hypothetical protein Cni_G04299 [Canna indica]|uniref:BHLH domain-containing protein n=1 Tax=Canna indica TaxID=4628 RepID=A0AAQ3JT98_9LILI|nr:hypothetical protein Cni_G04299 [Canna indica]
MYSTQPSEDVVGTSTSMAFCAASRVGEEYLGNTWDPLNVVQRMDFIEANRISPYNIRLPLDQELRGVVSGPSLSSHDSGRRSHEDMSSFPLSESYQLGTHPCPPHAPAIIKHSSEANIKGDKRKLLAECGALPSHSPGNNVQNVKAEESLDVSLESVKDSLMKDEKKQKNELSPSSSNHRTTTKTAKGSRDADSSKDDYIHIRAKRGQATNSHSLAERVRREKISERMRLLQDLVPGCSKINGKAMMLDEIINYVQSLQRQVEFLSMKLAAVHPEVNFDLEQILSKDVLQSCYGGSGALAFGSGMSSFHPQLYGSTFQRISQPEIFYSSPSTGDLQQASISQVSDMAQQLPSTWHDELHNPIRIPTNGIPTETSTDHHCVNSLEGAFKSF